jgi:hypothetical protein
MNDFTKEELKELLDAIRWKLGEGQADSLTFPLEAKLKSMIDNYCEHELVRIDYDCNPDRCVTCQEIVGE